MFRRSALLAAVMLSVSVGISAQEARKDGKKDVALPEKKAPGKSDNKKDVALPEKKAPGKNDNKKDVALPTKGGEGKKDNKKVDVK